MVFSEIGKRNVNKLIGIGDSFKITCYFVTYNLTENSVMTDNNNYTSGFHVNVIYVLSHGNGSDKMNHRRIRYAKWGFKVLYEVFHTTSVFREITRIPNKTYQRRIGKFYNRGIHNYDSGVYANTISHENENDKPNLKQ